MSTRQDFASFAAYTPPPDALPEAGASKFKRPWFPAHQSSNFVQGVAGPSSGSYQAGGVPTFGTSIGGGAGHVEDQMGVNEWETRFGWRADIEAAAAYLGGPITALLLLILETSNDFVRFHACSLLTALAATVPITKYAGPVKPNSYIIKLKDDVLKGSHITELLFQTDSKIVYDYEAAFHGYAVELVGRGLDFVRRSREVEYIVEDGIVGLDFEMLEDAGKMPPSVMPKDQVPISTRTDGAGVDIYSLDSGIQINHTCFGGRARWGKTFGGYADADNYGHGTHTAATAVGDTFGLATSANVIAVKVLGDNGLGPWSDVIAGIDYVLTQSSESGRPSIATLSLSGLAYPPIDAAVSNAIAKGIHFTVAAGNLGIDAIRLSPAHVKEANTIGAVDWNYARAGFSNFGPSVDGWALGVDVTSAWIGPTGYETKVLSGTSMATPLVAGVLAVAIGDYGNKLPAELSKDLKDHARPVVTGVPNGTTNLLVAQW
ncbi:unnamed protein product [Rhizoctonia solani]|uniref:Peptidase S8/S53 domain-containing protein n=1 Tax=Rhizoctonia solani TaxID=456999 RepID=A0A8H3I3R0_9AGAM|nr:unnamed protein product [Rhizoctonia solani]